MRKKIDKWFFIKIILYSRHLPSIILQVKNWPSFLLHYIGLKSDPCTYLFRDGLKIKTIDSIAAVTIAVIFFKKDYGKVKSGSTVIDIGANIGAYSLFASRAGNTKVYAYEPMPDNYALLAENIALNRLDGRVFAFNAAVGAKKEMRNLYLGGSPFHSLYPINGKPGAGPGKNRMDIPCTSLKDILEEHDITTCDILKMDCEGAEFEILYNLPDAYFGRIKEIRLEYHNHADGSNNNDKHLLAFLEGKGYHLTKIKKVDNSNGDMWLEKSGK